MGKGEAQPADDKKQIHEIPGKGDQGVNHRGVPAIRHQEQPVMENDGHAGRCAQNIHPNQLQYYFSIYGFQGCSPCLDPMASDLFSLKKGTITKSLYSNSRAKVWPGIEAGNQKSQHFEEGNEHICRLNL